GRCRPAVTVAVVSRARRPPIAALFPYTTLFRSLIGEQRLVTAHEIDLRQVASELAREIVAGDLHCIADALAGAGAATPGAWTGRSEEHTSELQSRENLVCRLLLEKKNRMTSGAC